MSSQRGNLSRSRPQKHKNTFAFKSTLYDKNPKTKELNDIVIDCVCKRCKDIIEWKIKYKKYKPLTVPRKCTRCGSKSIKKAYYILCDPCINTTGTCGKCAQPLSEESLTTSNNEEKIAQDEISDSD